MLRESLILTFCVLLQFMAGFLISSPYVAIFQLPFFLLQFIFSIRRVNNWFAPSLLISFEISLITLSWLPTLDTWDILHYNHQISETTYLSYFYLFIFLQQLALFLIICLMNYLWKRFFPSDTPLLLPKKYRLLSISLLFMLFLAVIIKQINVLTGDTFSLMYSLFIIVGYTILISWNLLIVIKSNNEKQYIALLSETYNREKSKISLSNEFRQDYKMFLQSLTAYLEVGDKEKAIEQLNGIIQYSDSLLTPNLYRKISGIDNLPIQALLTSFLNKCLAASIQLNIHITENLANIDMNIVDFIRCFSILLDNAYEATGKTTSPSIELSITGTAETVTIEVDNTYENNQQIPFSAFLQNNFSTKEGHLGKGLYIFITILKSYKQSSHNFTNKNNHFIAKFTFPKK
ncbi:GHKL domain-containing protein [Enterococcus sp. DIV0212c]|uniref:GHKL domain-containing protein n=1 Tax=Enterococcus sp. DIV0212c TaxID=2230867 RepID=UPI0035C86764